VESATREEHALRERPAVLGILLRVPFGSDLIHRAIRQAFFFAAFALRLVWPTSLVHRRGIEQPLYEATMLLNAVSLINRICKET